MMATQAAEAGLLTAQANIDALAHSAEAILFPEAVELDPDLLRPMSASQDSAQFG